MKIIALDWGEKRIGVAISDDLGKIARGLTVIDDADYASRLRKMGTIIEDYQVKEMVIGLPFRLAGNRGEEANQIEPLAEKLKDEFQIPVHLQDERLSTKEVERLLVSFDLSRGKRKKIRDKLAAQIILQTFLDKKNVHK